jgi:hypothetical protein
MAWDHTKNFEIVAGGKKIEFGEATIAGGTIEIPTHLKSCQAALVTYKEAHGGSGPPMCDCTITNGAMTVTGGDKKISYMFCGF